MNKDKNSRSLLKAISWRIIGSLDTIIISFFHSGNLNTACKITTTEFFTKIILYYFHERFWFRISDNSNKKRFSLYKAISWRTIGTLDTIIISYFYSNDLLIGLKIGVTELITKIIIYYIHERIWLKIK